MSALCRSIAIFIIVFVAGIILPTYSRAQMTFEESVEVWKNGDHDGNKVIEGNVVIRTGFFSWEVALGYSEISDDFAAHFCGGVSVAPSIVLTAAHCVLRAGDHPIFVLSGTAKLSSGGTRHAVVNSFISPLYNPETKENDLAIVVVDGGTLPASIPIADMPESLLDETILTISGWGVMDSSRKTFKSDDLREAHVPTQATDVCNAPDALSGRITGSMFCAGKISGGSDTCLGDSGGPAIVETPDGAFLVGIVSWGDGCGQPKKYGVYVKVFPHVDWIKQIANHG
ncbi:MAG: serine protease [Mesorhizobium sp.]|nr:MAG: serine protease [Mesorhizobium sp.]